jgi:zinc protease
VPSPGVTLEALEAALNLAVERFLASGPTEAELRRSRTRLVADTIYARDSQSSLARLYGSSLAVGDSIEDIERWPERLEAVTAGQVVAAARAHVDLRRGVTGRLMNA